jgi:hypothetical protein
VKRRFITLQAYRATSEERSFSAVRSPGPSLLGTGWEYDVPRGWRVVSITPGNGYGGDYPWWLILLEEIGVPGVDGGPYR